MLAVAAVEAVVRAAAAESAGAVLATAMAVAPAVAAQATAQVWVTATASVGPVSLVAAEWPAAGLAMGSEMDQAVAAAEREAPANRATGEGISTAVAAAAM
jgi:hypothetical protein